MEMFTLNESHITGVKFIDDEHAQLSDQLNEIISLYKTGNSKEIIFDRLQNFLFLVKNHFSSEEKYMMNLRYENYFSHKIEHDRCIRKIIEFQGNLYKDDNCIPEFYDFIKNWLTNHLLFKDVRLANFLLEKNIQ